MRKEDEDLVSYQNRDAQTRANGPVVVVVTAVDVGPAFQQDGSDCERGELADGVAAHTCGVAVDGQV